MTTRKQQTEPRRPSRTGRGWMFLIAGALVLCPSTGVQPAAAQLCPDCPLIVDPIVVEKKEYLTMKDMTEMPPEHVELSEAIVACLLEGKARYGEPIKITIDRVDYWVGGETCAYDPERVDLEIYDTKIVHESGENERYGIPGEIALLDAQRNGVQVVVCVKNHGPSNAAYWLVLGHSVRETFKTVRWPSGLPAQGPLTSRCSVVTVPWTVVEEEGDRNASQFCFGVFVFHINGGLYQDRDIPNHQARDCVSIYNWG